MCIVKSSISKIIENYFLCIRSLLKIYIWLHRNTGGAKNAYNNKTYAQNLLYCLFKNINNNISVIILVAYELL